MYFEKIASLLFEPAFMKFLTVTNSWYIQDHNPKLWESMLADEGSFEISLSQWHQFLENRRGFKAIALQHLQKRYFNDDWEALNLEMEKLFELNPKLFKEKLKSIVVEISTLKNRISKREYFAPIAEDVTNILNKVIVQYEEFIDASKIGDNKGERSKSSPIEWRGGVGTLCTLFRDLSEKKLVNGKSYISLPKPQLVEFILSNFVEVGGAKFVDTTVRDYIYKKGKYAVIDRVDISDLDK